MENTTPVSRAKRVQAVFLALQKGETSAAGELLPLLYDELCELAHRRLAREAPGGTLQTTDLVHEAYLRLTGPEGLEPQWDSRGHFFGAAAQAMRRILVERARRKKRLKHGGASGHVPLDDAPALQEPPADEVLALDEALDRLDAMDPRKRQVVELRFFAGLTSAEIAEVLNVSIRTVEVDWKLARALLHQQLNCAAATRITGDGP